jgi:hypothetical protein
MQYWENDVSYRYGTPQDTTLITPPDSTAVSNFCQSNIYWNIDRQSRTVRDSLIIEQKLEKEGIVLFPNPSKGDITLKLKQKDGLLSNIFVTDMNGRRVYSAIEGNQPLTNGFVKRLSLSIPSGSYIITAITSKGTLSAKFIVTR